MPHSIRMNALFPFGLLILASLSAWSANEPSKFQPWAFPPENTGYYIAGELIAQNHIQATGTLRVDRTDAQRRGDWDLPLDFAMLPYGSISYHGAPADMRHIPIGTHLHGLFYEGGQKSVDAAKLEPKVRRSSLDSKYNRVLKFEDDFSRDTRLKRTWRVDEVALDAGTITVTGVTDGKADLKPTMFHVTLGTRVWKGKGIGTLQDLKVGQQITMNLTYCTLKGPGRCVAIWMDDEARKLATTHQIEIHRQFMREHGLPGVISKVDNAKGIVTVALFGGFDTKLMDDFASNAALAAAAKGPPFVPGPGLVDPIAVTGAVAEDNLRTWDQINDRKVGPLLETIQTAPQPGFSGYQIRFQPSLLLEGFRPQRIIRVWPSKWKVDDLPREERQYQ